MLPSFTTSVPPRIPSSVVSDSAFSRILKVGKMESLSLDSSKVVGTATLVAGTVNVAIPGIESTDLVFVTLKSINSSPVLGAQYLVTFTAAVGLVPAFITITSKTDAAATATTDVSIVQYLVVKPYPVLA